jgi:RHS repeat-associated protein
MQINTCNASSPAQQWTGSVTDADGAQNTLRQKDTMDGTNVAVSEVHSPTVTQTGLRPTPVTGGQDIRAFRTLDTDVQTRTRIKATSSWRWTRAQTTYDTYAEVTDLHDYGDQASSSDDTCTHTDYARNTSAYLIAYPSQTVTTDCAGTPSDTDYLSGTQTLYDGSTTVGTAPTQGLATRTNALASVSGGTKSWKQADRTDYDANGRTVAHYDALNRKTATTYSPATGSLPTQTTVTDPAGFATTTTVEAGHGVPTSVVDPNGKVSTARYDPLGRVVKAWLDNRPTSATPDVQYTYTLSNTAPNAVQTQRLNPAGGQVSSYELYDGRFRARQVQTAPPQANGGRNIENAEYDSRGLKVKTWSLYDSANTPTGGGFAAVSDANIKNEHVFTFDNLARQTADKFVSGGVLQWQTTTAYDGDRATVTAPKGGVATRTLTNARGKTTELDQYLGSSPTGTPQATKYSYDRLSRQTKLTDPAGNVWTTKYDLRGRTSGQTDPDAGSTSLSHDDAGQLTSTKDARGTTVSYVYDVLGRKTQAWQGAVSTGTKLADYMYDTLAKGQLSSSVRYTTGGAYTTAVTGYDDAYRPLGAKVTVPSGDGFSPNSWTTTQTYNVDGSPASTTVPAAGGLTAEKLTYGYDTTGYPVTLTGATTYVTNTRYFGWGPVQRLDLGTGGAEQLTTTYDEGTGRLTGTRAGNGSTTQLITSYTYDPAGNVTAKWSTESNGTKYAECFRYDGLRELKDAWTIAAGKVTGDCATAPAQSNIGGIDPYWSTYTYDTKTGNRRTQLVHVGTGDTTYTYAYPAAKAAQPHGVTSVTASGAKTGTSTYAYDAAGNTKTRNVAGRTGQTLTFDAEGHLATVTEGSKVTTYVYDADGNRIAAKDSTGETLYLGNTEIHRSTTGTVSATRFYVHAGRHVAVRTDSGALAWQATDNHGTTELSVNASTLALTRLRTDPFGNKRDSTAWPSSKGFVSGTTDPTGLTHLGAREYDPGIGRFISRDSVLDPTSPQQINGYTYANGNPVTTSDPTGKRVYDPDDDGSSPGNGWCPDPGGCLPPPPPRATPPRVTSPALQNILDDIYPKTNATNLQGDGKVGTAVVYELQTGQQVHGHWHVNDAADLLGRLSKLLEEDRRAGGTLLSDDDRTVAFNEAKELYEALETPDLGGGVAQELRDKPQRAQDLRGALDRVRKTVAMADVTGAEVDLNRGGHMVVKTQAPRMRGIGGAMLLLDYLPVLELIIEGARNGWDWDRTMEAMCEAMCVIPLGPPNPCAANPGRCMA